MLRLAWSFLYWNLRKGWFRARGARGRCACQNPSDSGAAHVTGCEAVIGWARPGRFRRVCPLLERGADGRWCCSVNAAEVRPFWGRAAAAAGVAGLAIYLGGTVAVFALLRARGYELSYRQVVWPPELRRAMPAARAEVFLKQTRTAYAAGQIKEALISLQSAWQADPGNYAAGMMLAQFSQAADPRLADQIYERLRGTHPERRAATVLVWFRELLTRGDYAGVARLAGEELPVATAKDKEGWLQAMIFVGRQMRDAAPLEALAAASGGLGPELREVVVTEAAVLRGTLAGEELRARLRVMPAATAPRYAWFYRLDRLLLGGWAQDAVTGVEAAKGHLPEREAAGLLLAACAVAGDEAARLRLLKTFLAAWTQLTDAEMEFLCAHLIRYPQAEALSAVGAAWSRDTRPPDAERLPVGLALYCAAVAGRDEVVRRAAEDWIRRASGGRLPDALQTLGEILRVSGQERLINRVLPALPPLPLEVLYALLSKQMQTKTLSP